MVGNALRQIFFLIGEFVLDMVTLQTKNQYMHKMGLFPSTVICLEYTTIMV